MRTRQWMTRILSGCLALAGGVSAFAQTPPPFPQYGPGNPDAVGMLPPPYNTNYGTVPQSYPGIEATGYPPGANAWPTVSPYMGPAMDQTANENGLWFNRQYMGNRKYYLNAEVLIGFTQRGSNTLIGAPNVNIVPVFPGQPVDPLHNQQFVETTAAADNMPNRRVTATGGAAGGGDVQIFVARSLHDMWDPNRAGGGRATWGWFNADESGFQLSGFGLNTASSTYLGGNGFSSYFGSNLQSYDPVDAVNFSPAYNIQHLRALSGIPLGGADSDGDFRPGFVMPFDIYFRTELTSQLAGANADWYGTSIYDRSSVLVRPVAGARFFQLREGFSFDGADSGLGYTIQGATQQQGNNNAAGQQVYSPLVIETEFSIPNVMNSHLHSQTRALLAGPEAGLRFDFGGDGFTLWTQSKFGLLSNTTQSNLSGYNIGDAYYVANGRTTPIMPRNSPDLTAFSSQNTSTWLSPMFEQQVNIKANVLQFVPIVNKARIFNSAEFSAGYTLVVIGEVQRPAQQINWQAFPVNPKLQTDRTTYTNNIMSLGVEWNY